jgi:cytochrome c oxidase subunit 2
MLNALNLFKNLFIYNDSPEPWAIGFQDGVSPGYTGIIELHDNIFFYLVVIAILVFWMLGSTIYYFNYDKTKITHKYLVHGTLIEILWTIFPAIVLLAIAIPSFRLLYILDEVTLPTITVKVTGHQWYWSYEYSDYETESGDPIEFDSYMIPDSDLEIGQTRLLEVDNPIVLPENTHVRFIVTSTDVLHDFAIPSAGIKIDATPGRLNQSSFFSEREGELFGQCSELCGTYHGFMPIQVEVGSVEDYLSWISSLSLFIMVSPKKKSKLYISTPISGTKNNLNLIFCNGLHSSAIILSPNDDLVERALHAQDDMDDTNVRLQVVKYQESNNLEEDLKITSVSESSTYEESFPWFVKDGKIINYEENISLEKGVEVAAHFLKKRENFSEDDICKLKLSELIKPWAEGKDTTVIQFLNYLSNLIDKDKNILMKSSFLPESNDTSSTASLPLRMLGKEVVLPLKERPLGEIGDLTLNQIFSKFNGFNLPVGNITMTVEAFKFVPTILIYRGIVNAYINSSWPLDIINKMEPKLREEHLIRRGHATRLWACYFAPIATVTILAFVQKGFPISFNVNDTLNSILPDNSPLSAASQEVKDNEVGTSVKNAFIYLFLSNKLKKLSCYLKGMSTWQIFKFIFKTLSKFILIIVFIYYYIDSKVVLSYLAKISLYDLAKIWLVGNIGCLLYTISNLILYVYYCKLLDQGVKEENVQISNYWPTFISNWLNSLLILSTGPEDYRKRWINQYWIDIFFYSCSVSVLCYFLWG